MNASESQRTSLNQRIFAVRCLNRVTSDFRPATGNVLTPSARRDVGASSQDQTADYVAVTDVPSPPVLATARLPPTTTAHTFPQKCPSTASAQVIDHDALMLPKDDVCLLRHTSYTPCSFACGIAVGLSVETRLPAPGRGKPRSFWLLVGEAGVDKASAANGAAGPEVTSQAALDPTSCELLHDFAGRFRAAGWKARVDELEKVAAREGRRLTTRRTR